MESFLGLFDASDQMEELVSSDEFYTSESQNESGTATSVILDFDQGILPAEPQIGNIEYKLKLVNPSQKRFEQLVTQMKWRLREGPGEAIYEIGVLDSGQMHGLDDSDMTASLHTLTQMAHKLNASTTVLRRKMIDNHKSVAEVLVRLIPDDQHNIEIRVAVLGGSDAGKSTLLGVLIHGEIDNGQGRARLNMFRHMHEIRSGRTSCISHATLGFNSHGNVINYKFSEMMTVEEISDKPSKIVTIMDLAGHRRYMKTTVQALTGYAPHHAMLVVGSSGNISHMMEEHLAIVKALEIPFFIVVTKIDLTSPQNTLQKLKEMLTSVGCRKVPIVVETDDDAITIGSHQPIEQIVPIFCISNVTGAGLDLVTRYLYMLPPGINSAEKEKLEQEPSEFHIDEIIKVDGEQVVAGLHVNGVLTERSAMRIGPLNDGSFLPVVVQTIHRNKSPCRVVRAGQSASLSFGGSANLPPLRSGMVLLMDTPCNNAEARGSLFFQAKITVLFHATAIYVGFQSTVHIGNIRQTAVIEGIMGYDRIETNSTASVIFRFVRHPEYVKTGSRILFREGISKGVGRITQVFSL